MRTTTVWLPGVAARYSAVLYLLLAHASCALADT
jgi:hypothetical protein